MFTMCIATVIINLTPEWTLQDQKNMDRAIYVCKTKYRGCLSKFIKKETRVYNAICKEIK